MIKGLVSVIVPIYNVEKYLDICLKSIVAQSYRNFQAILVNDGSPDNSKDICEVYCKKDNRFILINKKNGGLASARNAGLERAEGEFIVCVDSDDWIEPNMIEILLNNMMRYEADLSVCSFYEDISIKGAKKETFTLRTELISKEDAIKRLITPGKFYGFAWNKMYKTGLVGNQRYDETILKGEDSPFSCDYILKCNKAVVQDIPLYHYRIDSVSISRSKFNVGKMTVLKSYQYIIDRLSKECFDNDIIDMQKVQYANQLLSLKTNIMLSGKDKYRSQLEVIDAQMGQYKKLYLKSKSIDIKHKLAYILGTSSNYMFDVICRIYGG